VHVIFAHPLEDSYGAALRDVVIQSLKGGGHTVDLCDLYREAFDPVLSVRERQTYRDTASNTENVTEHVHRLRQPEGVVFVFPSWWYGMPAILKGYFDRVWLPGVAFDFGPQAIIPLLTNIRLFGVVTTTGAPQWFTRFYVGNPSRKVLLRGLARLMVARGAERIWLALYVAWRKRPRSPALRSSNACANVLVGLGRSRAPFFAALHESENWHIAAVRGAAPVRPLSGVDLPCVRDAGHVCC
jgi:putative NADPH-quinone reductase